jgi:DNA-binding CsgD family transcriptional regulator
MEAVLDVNSGPRCDDQRGTPVPVTQEATMAYTTVATTQLDDGTDAYQGRVNRGRFLRVVSAPSPTGRPSITGSIDPVVKPDGTMLFSRKCLELDQLLEQVRFGRGGPLVLLGETGVGKTTLLDQAVTSFRDFRFVRVFGVEAEKELPFAAIQQLCGQLDGLERLPDPQADALRAAFGVRETTWPDRLFVGLAVHSLLVEAADQRPVVCLVDDAQSLDPPSARTLAFVARRLEGFPVALVFASSELSDELAGLPFAEIDGLSRLEARSLVERVIPGPLDEEVRARLVSETEGQPLSIVKLLSSVGLATIVSEFGLPCATPWPRTLEESFRQRLECLPEETRLFLLLAAAEPLGRPSVLWRAADVLGINLRAIRHAEADGLLRLGAPVRFCHPLMRSAVYRAASPVERRRAHQALAEATNPEIDPDRRTWHRSQAASAPNGRLAGKLAQQARRARVNGGCTAAASLLEQAAALTPDPSVRSERLLAAAEARLAAGAVEAAQDLLPRVESRLLNERDGARLQRLWAEVIVVQGGGSDAPHLLLNAAKRFEPLDRRLARETYLRAFDVALDTGHLKDDVAITEAAHAVWTGPATPEPPQGTDLLLDGLATLATEGRRAAVPVLKRAIRSFDGRRDSRWLSLGAETALNLWDDRIANSLATRHKELSLRAGSLLDHQRSLAILAGLSVLGGDFAEAADLIDRTRLLTRAPVADSLCMPLMLAAFRGREVETPALIQSTTQQATLRRDPRMVAFAECMAAVFHNGLGQYRKALAAARRAAEHCEFGISDWALAELVEAAARCGEWQDGKAAFERLSERATLCGTEWALGVKAYSHALLSDGQTAEELYRTAIELLGRCSIAMGLARAHLVYGEWLRRDRRRREARQQLRTALEMFTTMGAEAFAERAERELLATGERLQKRGAESSTQLTPQEAQISQLARDGNSNPEIAAKLYISPRTVEYHLRKVFRKLGIGSRNELRRVLLDTGEF